MFRITLEPGGTTRLFVEDVVQIGSDSGLELVLAGTDVLSLHAVIYEREGRVAIAPRPGSTEPYLVSPTDRIAIGRHTLRVELVGDETGARLLAAIDPASRPIYADWCEEQGELVRAEYLRALDAPDHAARVRELAPQIPRAWRAQVAGGQPPPRRAPPASAIVRRLPACCWGPFLKIDGRWFPASGSRVMRCRHAWCTGLSLASALTATVDDHQPITEAEADARFTRTGFAWTVEPGRAIGPLVLGMSEAELAAAWATIPRVCRNEDDMGQPDITTHFDADGRCNSIGVWIDQPVPVLLDGIDLRVTAKPSPDPGVSLGKWEHSDPDYSVVYVTLPSHFSRNLPRR